MAAQLSETVPAAAGVVAHGTVTADVPLILCFLAGILLSGPGRASLMLLRYTNNATAVAWSSCAFAFGGMALSIPLAHLYGGFGVALAFAVTETVAVGLYPPILVERLFGFSALRHLGESYFVGAVVFALSYGVADALFAGVPARPLALALRVAVWAIVALPAALVVVLRREHRRRLARPLVRLMPLRS